MLQEALISKENIIPLIDKYSKEKKNEIVSILLEYSQNSNGDDFEYLD